MKKLITSMLIGAIILLSLNLFSQSREIVEKYSKVKITILDRSDIKELQQAGLSLEGMKLQEQSVEVILSHREIMKLKDLGFFYEVLIDDMSKYYEERNKRTHTEMKSIEKVMQEKYNIGGFGFGSMGGFYTYSEVVAELDTMRMLYPNLITAKDSIGSTIEGRIIWAVKISDNPDITEGEPEVFYNSLVHAREPAGMMSVIYFMYYLLENYGLDPEVTYLVDNRELYFVPVVNVDGYVYNQQTDPNGGGMWRKNRKDNGNGCFGVDLNRNFGYMWGYNNIGSDPDPCHINFRGLNAFSEFESQALRDYCNSRNFKLGINFHTYGDYLLYPWDCTNSPTPDNDWYIQCSSNMVTFNGYDAGQTNIILYDINGSANDWMYGEQTTKSKILSYEIEVGTETDYFWPIPERIFPLAEENVYLNKVLAWGLGVIENPPYIIQAKINPSSYIPPGDSISVTAEELNPDNYNSAVTAYIINLEDSTVDEFELSKIDSNNFKGTRLIPGAENFYRIMLKDRGISIPSNFYYKEDSRFTTAGPVKLDSIAVKKQFANYSATIYLHNYGTMTSVPKGTVRLLCNDSWINYLTSIPVGFPLLAPGSSVSSGAILFSRVDSLFPGYYNFKVEVMSDGWKYWTDSIKVITQIDDEVQQPITFKLEQNYPNPFNPSTRIKYSIPPSHSPLLGGARGGFITLKVYDVLGNEIATLVNEEKDAGSFEVEFNPVSGNWNLASGVYFYQLKAGNPESSSGQVFIDTKKMILLR